MQTTSGRALVLGGGGSTGNAWLVGVAAGLAEAGTDVTTADLTIGTSAGSTAAAHLVGGAPAERYASILGEQPPPQRPQGGLTSDHLDRLRAVIEASVDLPDYRRRSGAAALEMLVASDGSWQDRWRGIVAARLQGLDWPDRRVLITAVDAATGEPVELDRDSGVSLVDAVAASCAGGLPFRIGDRWYVDGGYRRNADNADLARGCARVLVLSPLGGRALTPAAWARTSRRRWTSCAPPAAAWSRSSRRTTPRTCSAPTRWTSRCDPPRRGPATSWGGPGPTPSPRAGPEGRGPREMGPACSGLLGPLLDHDGRGVDADDPQDAVAGVAEAVQGVRGRDGGVAGSRDDRRRRRRSSPRPRGR